MTDHPRTTRRPIGPGNRWELVWSHRDELLEIARRRSSSADEAEDAVQEAMLRAVEDKNVQYGRVRSWLRHATVRACAERHRQLARDAELSTSPSTAPAEPLPVEEAACDRAEARWLADLSDELLPARQAEALRLRSQDLDVTEVARAMGLSYRATESLLARARRSLRDVLAGSFVLAMLVWTFVRRFPRTGATRSAVAASAAVTAATVGLSLPAAPPDRPDGHPPRADAGALRPAPATDFSTPRPAPERPQAPSPSPAPDRVARVTRDAPQPDPGNPPGNHEPGAAAAVGIRIGSVTLTAGLPSASTPTSIPPLRVEAPHASFTQAPSAPSRIATDTATALSHLPRPDRRGALPR
ncbi:RNA polymerase sigma factor [Streptomyces atroolivaceus]|uniref:RNA polymerase sigma factor n=1 Tax=Streptomyces atroolivaceus TaxID=66869 RepID=UPI00368E2336